LTYGSGIWAMTTEETNALKIFRRKIVRRIHRPHKRRTLGNKSKKMKYILQGADITKFVKSL
jgi:hypothetical protein